MDESNRSDEKITRTITLVRAAAQRGEPFKAVIKVTIRRCDGVSPHLDIDLAPCGRYTELSIVGEVYCVGDRRGDPSSCGQCVDLVREAFSGHEGEGLNGERGSVTELCDLWDRWHLNGMRAGTRAQAEHLREHPPAEPFYPVGHYEKAMEILKAADLYTDRGYKYGQSWLVELLPDDVLKRLGEICRAFGAKES